MKRGLPYLTLPYCVWSAASLGPILSSAQAGPTRSRQGWPNPLGSLFLHRFLPYLTLPYLSSLHLPRRMPIIIQDVLLSLVHVPSSPGRVGILFVPAANEKELMLFDGT